MQSEINCIYNDHSLWCTHKEVIASKFGVSNSGCIDFIDGVGTCKFCTRRSLNPLDEIPNQFVN